MSFYDPTEEDRRPTRSEAAADEALDAQDRAWRDRQVARIAERLGFADRNDLLSAVCPEPWNTLHPGHDKCEAQVVTLRATVARIIHRYITTY